MRTLSLLVLLMFGCGQECPRMPDQKKYSGWNGDYAAQAAWKIGACREIKYLRDPRTNLCFAFVRRELDGASAFSEVPCTKAVLELVENK